MTIRRTAITTSRMTIAIASPYSAGDHQDDRYYADNTAHDGEPYEDANQALPRGLITIAAVLGLP